MPSIFSLPLHIRERIYALAGLQRPCPINITSETHLIAERRQRRRRGLLRGRGECVLVQLSIGIFSHSSIDCSCTNLPVAILRVCRQFYNEALPVLYGGNDLMIMARTADDLRVLRELAPEALAHLRSLLVRLNCWPCPNGHEYYAQPREGHRCWTCDEPAPSADPELSLRDGTGRSRAMLDEWAAVTSHLAAHLTPRQLHLSLIADVQNADGTEEEAQIVLSNLYKLPQLQQLDLRLGRTKSPRLTNLAHEAAATMTGQWRPPPGIFPFSKLPPELRLRILSLTALSPGSFPLECTRNHRLRRYTWVRGQGATRARPVRVFINGGPSRSFNGLLQINGRAYRAPDAHNYNPAERIWIRDNKLDARHWLSRSRDCCRNCTLTAYSCCCPNTHAAASAYCACRVIPFDLFRVSRAMRAEAAEVFYGQNEFVFHQDFDATARFLRGLETGLAGLVRRVTVKMPERSIREDDVRFLSRAGDLRGLVAVMNETLMVGKVSFTFDTEDYGDVVLWAESGRLDELYEEHCKMVEVVRGLEWPLRVAILTCDERWTAALMAQLQDGEIQEVT